MMWFDVMKCAKTVEEVISQYVTIQNQRDLAQRNLPYLQTKEDDGRDLPYLNERSYTSDARVPRSDAQEDVKETEQVDRELENIKADENVRMLLQRLVRRLVHVETKGNKPSYLK